MAQNVAHRTINVDANSDTLGNGFDPALPNGVVDSIEVRIPSGHAGKTGIVIWYAATQLVPDAGSQYLKGNGATFHFDLEMIPTGTGWSWTAHNDDVFDHQFYLTFNINPFPIPDDLNLAPVILLPFNPSPGDIPVHTLTSIL